MNIDDMAATYAENEDLGTHVDNLIAEAYKSGAEYMLMKAVDWIRKQGAKDNKGVVIISVDDFNKAMEE